MGLRDRGAAGWAMSRWVWLLVGCAGAPGSAPVSPAGLAWVTPQPRCPTDAAWVGEAAPSEFDEQRPVVADVNGDGFEDVLRMTFSVYPAIGPSEDRLRVWFGGPLGPGLLPDLDMVEAKAQWREPAGAGDFDGDGYDDVVLEAPDLLVVWYGGPGGLSRRSEVPAPGEWLYRIAVVDLDGDGYDDLVAGDPDDGGGGARAGVLRVHLGGPSGLAATPDQVFLGELGGKLGDIVQPAGDVTGDGWADVIVCTGETTPAGRLYEGGPGGLTGAWTPVAEIGAAFDPCSYVGTVRAVGDVSGDGFADVLLAGTAVSFPGAARAGEVRLVPGGPGGLNGPPIASWRGPATDTYLGSYLRRPMDLDGDGYADVVVGGNGWWGPDGRWWRHAYLRGGPMGFEPDLAPLRTSWVEDGDRIDRTDVFPADLDGDGVAELVIAGLDYGQGPGRVAAIPSAQFGTSGGGWADELALVDASERLGDYRAARAGDVNGDGAEEVIVTWTHQRGARHVVRMWAVRGGSGGFSTAFEWSPIDSTCVDEWEGAPRVIPAGDVNGDGYADVLLSCPAGLGATTDGQGWLRLYLGDRSGLPSTAAWERLGTSTSGDQLGEFGVAVGDWNGDGYSDLAVGNALGGVEAHAGGPSGMGGGVFVFLPFSGTGYRPTLAAAGDMDGDGWDDVVVGMPPDRVYVARGSAGGLVAPTSPPITASWIHGLLGSAAAGLSDPLIGRMVSPVGDLDGDGAGDLFLTAGGSPDWWLVVSSAGAAATQPLLWTARDIGWDDPRVVGGDLNRDGYGDLVVHGGEHLRVDLPAVWLGGPAGLTAAPGDLPCALRLDTPTVAVVDADGDGFDDVVSVVPKPWSDAPAGKVLWFPGGPDGVAACADGDGDGVCNPIDDDDDGDGFPDGVDTGPLDPRRCVDGDGDGCDDCASGAVDPSQDGPDVDADGLCDEGDPDPTDGPAGDLDGDGWPNEAEVAAGTDPTSPDTDGDGLLDPAEGAWGADPTRADTDGDGFSDFVEVSSGADPADAASTPDDTPAPPAPAGVDPGDDLGAEGPGCACDGASGGPWLGALVLLGARRRRR
jgi:hypothetical protein